MLSQAQPCLDFDQLVSEASFIAFFLASQAKQLIPSQASFICLPIYTIYFFFYETIFWLSNLCEAQGTYLLYPAPTTSFYYH